MELYPEQQRRRMALRLLALCALTRPVQVQPDTSAVPALADASAELPADTSAALAALQDALRALTRGGAAAGGSVAHSGVLALGCLQAPGSDDAAAYFLAASQLRGELVLLHTFDTALCGQLDVPLGSLALMVASDLLREEALCGLPPHVPCETPHTVLDLTQSGTLPYQRKLGAKLAAHAVEFAQNHSRALVGIATPRNLRTTYAARPLVLLFATVGFATEAEIAATHFWQKKLAVVARYYENTTATFALADKREMADEAAKFGLAHLDPDDTSEVGLGVLDDVLALATYPPSFAQEEYTHGPDGWKLSGGEPSVAHSTPSRFKADLGEAWDNRVVLEFVRGFLSSKQFRESYGTAPAGGSEDSLYPSMSETSRSGAVPLLLSQKRTAAYKRHYKAEKARGLTAIVGAQSAAALSGKDEFAGWHEGETLLAVSGGERGCEACAALDAAMARLGAAIASTQPALASKLLLATMDGAVRQPPCCPSPAPVPRPG